MRSTAVRDLMSSDVLTVSPGAPFKAVVRTLLERGVDAAPVVDDAGAPLGVVSLSDLTCHDEHPGGWSDLLLGGRERRQQRRKARARTARDLMRAPVVAVEPGTPVCEALARMTGAGVGRVVVVDRGRVVGVLTRSDVLRCYLRSDDDLRRDAETAVRESVGERGARLDLEVRDGVVLLAGWTELTSTAWAAAAAVRELPGVVDVDEQVLSDVDDTLVHEQAVHGPFV